MRCSKCEKRMWPWQSKIPVPLNWIVPAVTQTKNVLVCTDCAFKTFAVKLSELLK